MGVLVLLDSTEILGIRFSVCEFHFFMMRMVVIVFLDSTAIFGVLVLLDSTKRSLT